MTWEQIKLGDVLNLKRGYDLPNSQRKEGSVPVVSSSGITGFHSIAKVKSPGVVTGRYGTLGEVYFIDVDFWPLNTSLYVQDFKGNNPQFIAYFLKHSLRGTKSDKAAVPGVNRNDLHSKKVFFPKTIKIQEKIAYILSNYDDLIENNRRRIELLEESARSLYREWFVYLRFPGHEHTPIIDGIPEGWKKGKISDLGEIITGKTPSKTRSSYFGGEIPFVKTPDMHDQILIINTQESLSEEGAKSQPQKFISRGSVLVSCIGTVGVVAIASSTCQTNQQINSVVFQNEALSYYSFFALKEIKSRLEAMGGGATMVNVNKHKFSSIPIIIPSKKLIDLFGQIVKASFEQIEKLSLTNLKLAQARDLLLPRLMNGEIAV